MKLGELVRQAGLEVLALPDGGAEIYNGYTSDLLSDVMGHCPENSILITVQNHKNTVAVSTLAGVQAILVVHNRSIPDEMLALANREKVALLRTTFDQFTISCRIGALLGASSF
ncbi:MAG: DRTGG domain-containing protein [Kiritimatiellia bacterium]